MILKIKRTIINFFKDEESNWKKKRSRIKSGIQRRRKDRKKMTHIMLQEKGTYEKKI